jgi:hypothetical protein
MLAALLISNRRATPQPPEQVSVAEQPELVVA